MSDTFDSQPLGAIFDVDDTLLDNYPKQHKYGLHEYARLLAMREIGNKYGLRQLAELSEEQNRTVLARAYEHSIEGNIWQLFYEFGLVGTPIIEHEHALLREVAVRKHELYEPVLREFGAPLPKAVEFVRAVYVLTNGKIAIASGARRADVAAFLQMSGMEALFENRRVIAREDFAQAKPNPESFEKAFQSLDLPDKQRGLVLAFEDDPKGVTSAKQAGLCVCAITSRFDRTALLNGECAPDLIRESYVDFATTLGILL
ncbi:HAD family phosphatase [Candidatus Saccharibacteria bacterium]|nr:MAG: HAD family phosphatase [Candidatus Saccharibacteria bacterium]